MSVAFHGHSAVAGLLASAVVVAVLVVTVIAIAVVTRPGRRP